MACEIPQLIEMIILEQKELLETFWQFLDRPSNNDNSSDDSNMDSVDPSLDTLLASYFAKTITIFLTKQPAEVSQITKISKTRGRKQQVIPNTSYSYVDA